MNRLVWLDSMVAADKSAAFLPPSAPMAASTCLPVTNDLSISEADFMGVNTR